MCGRRGSAFNCSYLVVARSLTELLPHVLLFGSCQSQYCTSDHAPNLHLISINCSCALFFFSPTLVTIRPRSNDMECGSTDEPLNECTTLVHRTGCFPRAGHTAMCALTGCTRCSVKGVPVHVNMYYRGFTDLRPKRARYGQCTMLTISLQHHTVTPRILCCPFRLFHCVSDRLFFRFFFLHLGESSRLPGAHHRLFMFPFPVYFFFFLSGHEPTRQKVSSAPAKLFAFVRSFQHIFSSLAYDQKKKKKIQHINNQNYINAQEEQRVERVDYM